MLAQLIVVDIIAIEQHWNCGSITHAHVVPAWLKLKTVGTHTHTQYEHLISWRRLDVRIVQFTKEVVSEW